MKKEYECDTDNKIVLACSGGADLGQLADMTARKLRNNKICKMSCLALAGAGIKNSIAAFNKSNLLIIDGCPVDCGKKIITKSGIDNYEHLRLTDLGFEKGKTEITDEVLSKIFENAKKILSNGSENQNNR